jgi:hypothetical protein
VSGETQIYGVTMADFLALKAEVAELKAHVHGTHAPAINELDDRVDAHELALESQGKVLDALTKSDAEQLSLLHELLRSSRRVEELLMKEGE